MAHNHVTSLRIVDSDGVDKKDEFDNPVTIGSNIVLQSGINTSIDITEDNEIQFTAGNGIGTNDPVSYQKFLDIVNQVPPYSGAPYWISTLNLQGAFDGHFFMGVDPCYHVGQFLDGSIPDEPHLLSILDTCPACTDCPEYDDL